MLDKRDLCDAGDLKCLTGERFVMWEILYAWQIRGL